MVATARPANLKGFGVVLVVPLNIFGGSANFAWPLGYLASLDMDVEVRPAVTPSTLLIAYRGGLSMLPHISSVAVVAVPLPNPSWMSTLAHGSSIRRGTKRGTIQ